MVIDAVAISSSDLSRTAEFYTKLGFEFPEFNAEQEKHLEAVREDGSARLMIDRVDLMEEILGYKPTPSNHSTFAILMDNPAEVDKVYKDIKDMGEGTVVREPWDAFWGHRYLIIKDPDGYMVDVFANL